MTRSLPLDGRWLFTPAFPARAHIPAESGRRWPPILTGTDLKFWGIAARGTRLVKRRAVRSGPAQFLTRNEPRFLLRQAPRTTLRRGAFFCARSARNDRPQAVPDR